MFFLNLCEIPDSVTFFRIYIRFASYYLHQNKVYSSCLTFVHFFLYMFSTIHPFLFFIYMYILKDIYDKKELFVCKQPHFVLNSMKNTWKFWALLKSLLSYKSLLVNSTIHICYFNGIVYQRQYVFKCISGYNKASLKCYFSK